jgi:ABC-type Fe3+/spermidine/putrescine transport system ATPase subunit
MVLEVRGLIKRYGSGAAVVNGVSFDIRKSETLTLLGPSGCGKSTTLRMIAGLERPDAGEILVNGTLVVSTQKRVSVPAEKRNMGLVFQSYAIWPHMTVEENVGYPLKVRSVKQAEVRERVHRATELVGLGGLLKRPSTQLSGGQQQRVALARSLVYEPDILLLDEPLSNLDARLRHDMRIHIKRVQMALGTTILFVTHDQMEAMTLSHRIAVMRGGVVEQLGTPREIYQRPATRFVHSFIGRCLNFAGRVVSDGQAAHVEMGAGEQIEVDSRQWPVGTHAVWISVRPEDVELIPGVTRAARNQVLGVVSDVAYIGNAHECVLRVGEHEVALELPRSLEVRVGEPVALALEPALVKVWPQSENGVHETVDGEN